MKMYNTILVPIDFANNEQSIKTLQKAEKLLGGDEIIVLHVVEAVPEYIKAQLPEDFRSDKVDQAKNDLKKLVEKSGVVARIEVRKGGSYSSILESAKVNHVNLIIINSHRPDFQDYLLGSTAAKVVRHAQCSVLVER